MSRTQSCRCMSFVDSWIHVPWILGCQQINKSWSTRERSWTTRPQWRLGSFDIESSTSQRSEYIESLNTAFRCIFDLFRSMSWRILASRKVSSWWWWWPRWGRLQNLWRHSEFAYSPVETWNITKYHIFNDWSLCVLFAWFGLCTFIEGSFCIRSSSFFGFQHEIWCFFLAKSKRSGHCIDHWVLVSSQLNTYIYRYNNNNK